MSAVDVLSAMARGESYCFNSPLVGALDAANALTEARAAVVGLIDIVKRAENRLTYINIQSGKAIDADLVIAIRAALAACGVTP